MMIPEYESRSLLPYLDKLTAALNERDWDAIKFHAHTLKGPAGYIGASRLHYACYYICKAHSEGDVEQMIEYYPLVIETAIEVRHHVRLYQAKLPRGN